MYELSVNRDFAAAHAITIAGKREETHGHNWHVTVVVAGDQLDHDGLLCDFHLIENIVHRVIERFHNHDLNRTPPFDRVNPTAENVAQHIAESVQKELPGNVRLARVNVTEAPGCAATFLVS